MGGNGGYSTGILALSSDTICYLYTGSGGYSKVESTVFNGGGMAEASSDYDSGSGGGASDIRIGQDSLHARVIVAGGGGGGAGANETTFIGGYGGGTSGGGAVTNSSGAKNNTVTGGGATSAGTSSNPDSYKGLNGSFGVGGSYSGAGTRSGGGGGGGWYGGAAGSYGNAGGGGSGYVYTSSTASNYPSGCLLNSSYYLTDAQTIAGNAEFISPTGINETGHRDNGYIRITVIKAGSGNTLVKTDSTTWKNYKNIFINTGASTTIPSELVELEYIKLNGT
ncbi:MAG: glycine rich domain-containing protein [Clostridium sp.]|nr:glycine rich domain-containing protein [Clostridium sp.]